MRAKKFTSEGIVISRKNYSEADRILVIYTNDYGKLFVMAKGVRKLKSKKRGHLEVFSHIKFSASKGSGIDVMTEVESINDFHKIKKDLKKVALAYYFMEVVFKLTSHEEKNKELFRLILNYLDKLDIDKNLRTLRFSFIHDLLVLLGYWPVNRIMANPDKVLEEVLERQIYTLRVGKKLLS